MGMAMGSYDTEIRVSTKVDTSQMQKLQIQIDKAVDKVDALTKEYDELKNKKVPTQEYEKLQKELSAAQKEMEKLKAQDSKLSALDDKIGKLAQSSAEYAAKMKEVAEQRIPTQEYTEVQRQIENTEKKINDLMAKQEKMLATGGSRKSSVYKKMEYDLEELRSSLPYLKGELQDLVDTGKAFTLGTDTEQYKNLSSKYESVNLELEKQKGLHSEIAQKQAESVQKVIELKAQVNQLVEDGKAFTIGSEDEISSKFKELERAKAELRALITKQGELGRKSYKVSDGLKKIGSAAKKAFGAAGGEIKKSTSLLSSFLGKIKTIALAAFVFNAVRKAFNYMIDLMKKGFENFTNYSSDFANGIQGIKNAASTLGNQMVAAFAPIIQLIIPWITSLINAISTAMTYVAQFIAILGGKSTFTRAKRVQDSYNKSLGGTAAAAKKAAGALAKFDDLDVLQKKEDDSSGGAGGTPSGDMFEEVPVDPKFKNWLDGILEKLKPILDYLKKLKDIFMEGFWDGLGDWEYRLEIIKNALASIKESLIDIFTDPAVIEAADKWAQSVAYMLGSLVGSIASIGLTIAANLLGGIAEYLEQNKDRIKKHLISMFDIWEDINYLLADFFQSFAYVFEAFASEGGIQLTANLIGIFADAFMGVTEIASKLIRDILNIFIQPFVENKEAFRAALEGFLGVLAEITGTIKQGIDDTFDKLNEVYDSHFKPFFDSLANGLSELTSSFLDFWNGKVQPILEQWADKFDTLWNGHIQPFIDSFIELLGSIADLLKTLWEQWLKPIVDWIIQNVLPAIMPILETIYETVVTVIGDIADVLTGFIDTVKNVIDFIVALINGDWDSAWESMQNIIESVLNTISAFIQTMWDSLIGVIETALLAILEVIKVTFQGICDFVLKIWNDIQEYTSSFFEWIFENISTVLEGVKEIWNNAWTTIFETIIEVWTGIQEWFTEFWTIFTETLYEIWENIILFFTEAWENITLIFQTFIDFINETVIPIWQESWNMASSLFQAFHDLIDRLIKAIAEFFSGLMKTVKLLIEGDWKGAWENAQKIFTTFKEKVDEIIQTVREIIQSFFDWAMGLIESILSKISEVGSAISGIFGGGGGGDGSSSGGGASFAMARTAAYNLEGIPALASGAVIRGGNPFMAVLGDQPRGVTNIETPLPTMVDAFKQAIAETGGIGGGERVPVNINLNYDGETFARLSISDILSELDRQGYNVDVLGVT